MYCLSLLVRERGDRVPSNLVFHESRRGMFHDYTCVFKYCPLILGKDRLDV